ncbi:MAG: hypothetical protein ACYTAN_17325 [Planctomycetota bacterium]|jgi:hypothetical protein
MQPTSTTGIPRIIDRHWKVVAILSNSIALCAIGACIARGDSGTLFPVIALVPVANLVGTLLFERATDVWFREGAWVRHIFTVYAGKYAVFPLVSILFLLTLYGFCSSLAPERATQVALRHNLAEVLLVGALLGLQFWQMALQTRGLKRTGGLTQSPLRIAPPRPGYLSRFADLRVPTVLSIVLCVVQALCVFVASVAVGDRLVIIVFAVPLANLITYSHYLAELRKA